MSLYMKASDDGTVSATFEYVEEPLPAVRIRLAHLGQESAPIVVPFIGWQPGVPLSERRFADEMRSRHVPADWSAEYASHLRIEHPELPWVD
jgi:hypothetical protein